MTQFKIAPSILSADYANFDCFYHVLLFPFG